MVNDNKYGKGKGTGKRPMRRPRRPSDDVPKIQKEWIPITQLGRDVNSGEITDIEQIFDSGSKIMETEIVDRLLPDLEEELLLVGQAKGKFGGGQRRIFRQTQKKTMEGNKIQFLTCAVVGNNNGYVGVERGKSKETVPARDKSKRKARLSLVRVRRGCGSWECHCGESHSVPFAVTGKCGSSTITLMPAPKGKGLCVEKECAKILKLAGIKDVWSKTSGKTKTKLNLIGALIDALKKLSEIKVKPEDIEKLGIIEGKMKETKTDSFKESIKADESEPKAVEESATESTESTDNQEKEEVKEKETKDKDVGEK